MFLLVVTLVQVTFIHHLTSAGLECFGEITQEGARDSHPTSLVSRNGSEPIANPYAAGNFAAYTGRDV